MLSRIFGGLSGARKANPAEDQKTDTTQQEPPKPSATAPIPTPSGHSRGVAPLQMTECLRQSLERDRKETSALLLRNWQQEMKKYHQNVNATAFYAALNAGSLPIQVYLQNIVNQQLVFQSIEIALTVYQDQPWLKSLYAKVSPLFLAKKFSQDIDSLSTKLKSACPQPTAEARECVKELQGVIEKHPKCLAAFAYLMYSGILKHTTFEKRISRYLENSVGESDLEPYMHACRFTLPCPKEQYLKEFEELYSLIDLSLEERRHMLSAMLLFFDKSVIMHQSLMA